MSLKCRVQYLNDIDPFSYTTNFPDPPRPPMHTFSVTLPLINQLAAVHRLLNSPHRVSSLPRIFFVYIVCSLTYTRAVCLPCSDSDCGRSGSTLNSWRYLYVFVIDFIICAPNGNFLFVRIQCGSWWNNCLTQFKMYLAKFHWWISNFLFAVVRWIILI